MKTIVKAIAACLLVTSGVVAIAQTGNKAQHHPPTDSKTTKPMQMDMCKQMMADKKAMRIHSKEMDSKLEGLVSKMDRASKADKINAMSAIIKEMVGQKVMMTKMSEDMESKMMGHMMAHMKSGKMECPMMKDMKGMMGK